MAYRLKRANYGMSRASHQHGASGACAGKAASELNGPLRGASYRRPYLSDIGLACISLLPNPLYLHSSGRASAFWTRRVLKADVAGNAGSKLGWVGKAVTAQ